MELFDRSVKYDSDAILGMRHESAIIILMSNAINGQLITHDSEGAIKRDYLYRISIKALIYNDAGQILVVKEDGRPLWDSSWRRNGLW